MARLTARTVQIQRDRQRAGPLFRQRQHLGLPPVMEGAVCRQRRLVVPQPLMRQRRLQLELVQKHRGATAGRRRPGLPQRVQCLRGLAPLQPRAGSCQRGVEQPHVVPVGDERGLRLVQRLVRVLQRPLRDQRGGERVEKCRPVPRQQFVDMAGHLEGFLDGRIGTRAPIVLMQRLRALRAARQRQREIAAQPQAQRTGERRHRQLERFAQDAGGLVVMTHVIEHDAQHVVDAGLDIRPAAAARERHGAVQVLECQRLAATDEIPDRHRMQDQRLAAERVLLLEELTGLASHRVAGVRLALERMHPREQGERKSPVHPALLIREPGRRGLQLNLGLRVVQRQCAHQARNIRIRAQVTFEGGSWFRHGCGLRLHGGPRGRHASEKRPRERLVTVHRPAPCEPRGRPPARLAATARLAR